MLTKRRMERFDVSRALAESGADVPAMMEVCPHRKLEMCGGRTRSRDTPGRVPVTRALASVGIALTIALAGCHGIDFGDRPAREFPKRAAS